MKMEEKYKNMEGYIYLGEHYDVLNREVGISDKKIGLSINPIGSVAYKLALVSSGNYDIFTTIAPKNEWDICAGDCLVSEAGGVFKTINDKKIIYNQKKTLVTDTIIATNSVLFEGVSDLLF